MSLRLASIVPPGLLFLALLSGCPTRPAAEDAPSSDPTRVDAATMTPETAPDTTPTMSVTVADDAGVPFADAAGADDADAGDPTSIVEQPKLQPASLAAVGVVCSINSECGTGSCVDGVCCASAACGVCQSCAIPGTLGACSMLPALTEDPKNACTATLACDGKGRCAANNGNACASTADCITGFCVDGVCCESSCDQACYSCNTVFELKGTCQPLTGATDDNAAVPCSGSKSCAPGATPTQPLCLLVDGQACTAAPDCVSGQCSTFYADRDGDKYGNAASAISICGAQDAPPAGYVVTAGDCCDSDGNAHPGQSTWFSHGDACGSWDYNCDGYIEEQFTIGPCGGYSGAADCGKACIRSILGSSITSYTQACR